MTSSESIDLQENVPLAPLTTLKVGGPARFFVRAESEAEVVAAFEHARVSSLEVFVLGGGSNILVSDSGFDGLVIQVALKGIEITDSQLVAQAGEEWDAIVDRCVERDLAGIECLSGIPGFVGGTPVQNVGAYGQDVSETITSVRCYDRSTRAIVELSNEDCGFTYRTSIFNSIERDRYVVVSVSYHLRPGGAPNIEYKDLKERFLDERPGLADVRRAVLEIRRTKSMVIDPDDPNSRSAGSFFKNPIVDAVRVDEIASRAGVELIPTFPAGEGKVKVPAAWLIERTGFHKGLQLGNAGIGPGAGGTQRLTRAVGKAKAMDLCLTGRMMDAAEAERAGLVSRVVPLAELMSEALKCAQKIASASLASAMMIKECVNAAHETTLSQGIHLERRLFHAMFATEDQKEGMAAFVEKRKPAFKDR